MYSNKKSIQQLLALMLEHGVTNVVLSPGSRNAPLIHTFSQHPQLTCYTIVDERSAAYFALGLILKTQKPVAVCCTSGTALLNYSSATAEAYYQKLPLMVISADRPAHWVGQADGQTINQKNVLANFVKRSVTLPEIHSAEDLWLCNRLVNEALVALTRIDAGPVHVNIPLSEPLYEFTEEVIPLARKIRLVEGKADVPTAYVEEWGTFTKKMVVVGQLLPSEEMAGAIEKLSRRGDTVIIAEHTANLPSAVSVRQFEQVLVSLSEAEKAQFAPDILLTIGGHIVSKRFKQLIRKCQPSKHWRIGCDVVDTYQSLTDLLDVDAPSFVNEIAKVEVGATEYQDIWTNRSERIQSAGAEYLKSIPYCDLLVYKTIFERMPSGISLHLGNSTPVRYAQLFALSNDIDVYSNRGTSGIDGVVSTFAGFASKNDKMSLLVVGELSFLYDSNGLWNRYLSPKARIIVINNAGGGIFRLIDGPSRSEALEQHIEYRHGQSVENIARAFWVEYLSASNEKELENSFATLMDQNINKPMLLEVFTPSELNSEVYKGYFEYLKTK
ncbi:2-succinyl-5-enolpyruvyl-6-hydroxy-3-cyclohexene-1-carboxylic-acid synthase [uncultured Acetobacteroides sp.]|uniref:2-succinyl-5-enolpyruvyl-6-hydroxy-3- cyclohexene-1-carboxylic-acid synthase n=1 Tax=uncultured Acetobacteroides sp. TaxID=1760811 RepID=UPI0029F468C1|nr:2-succinyl-5-enolpyruvyl-6-hydroxy-3-cyclohexene-1-carboxylic-acid synthase [uncultured Acetobacteroides sp.]